VIYLLLRRNGLHIRSQVRKPGKSAFVIFVILRSLSPQQTTQPISTPFPEHYDDQGQPDDNPENPVDPTNIGFHNFASKHGATPR